MTKDKDPFVSLVCNETAELVPPLPDGTMQQKILMGAGALAAVVLVSVLVSKALGGSADEAKGGGGGGKGRGGNLSGGRPQATAGGDAAGNEWLSGTLAGTEKNHSPKKRAQKKGDRS